MGGFAAYRFRRNCRQDYERPDHFAVAGTALYDAQFTHDGINDGKYHRSKFIICRASILWTDPAPAAKGHVYSSRFFGGRFHLRDEVIRRLDVEPLLDATIGSLSKGQRKRALLAIGLLMPQPLLLADEPFDGLDLRQSRDVAQTLRSYASAGRTMFLSIHQIRDAARVCDRFVLLSGGRARGEGTLQELSALAAARGSAAGDDLEEVFLALT